MMSKKVLFLFGLLCGVLVSAFSFVEDFSTPDMALYPGRDIPKFVNDGGLDNSACAMFSGNGQYIEYKLPELVMDTLVEFSASIRTEIKGNVNNIRLTFGDDTLAWNRFYGYALLRGTEGVWKRLSLRILPAEKKYDIVLDGKVIKTQPLPKQGKPISRVRITYLGKERDGAAFVDNVHLEYTPASKIADTADLIREDFSYPAPSLWAANKDHATFVKEGGVDNSPCAKLHYNGQCLQRILTRPVEDRPLSVTMKVRFDCEIAMLRFVFGHDVIDWKNWQGSFTMTHANYAPGWYTVRIDIKPHPTHGGTFTMFINKTPVITNAKFRDGTLSTNRIGVIYLTSKVDKPAFIDDVELQYGPVLKLPPQEAVRVIFPDSKTLTIRTARAVIPLAIEGQQLSALKNFRLALFPNAGNFLSDADKTPVVTIPLALSAESPRTDVCLENIPFGFYTARILVDTAGGKDYVLREEYICRTHPVPRQPAEFPIRWGIDCHADRPMNPWLQELDSLVEAGANWTRLELNLANLTVPTDRQVRLEHHKKVLAAMKERGLHCFAVLNCAPRFGKLTPQADVACFGSEEAWEEVCRQIMTAFKGYVYYYEMWNEPQHYNWVHFQPGVVNEEQIGRLIKVARRVANEIDKDIKIMGPCLTRNMIEWINGIARVDGFKSLDFLSYHCNNFPDYRGQFYLRKVKDDTGIALKPFVTESSNDLRRLISSFAGETTSASFAYTILDKGSNPKNYEDYNGMVLRNGMPKNRHICYAWCATMLNHTEYIGHIFASDGISGYLFRENGVYKAAIFAERNAKLPKLAFANGVKRYDMLGNPFEGDTLLALKPGELVHTYIGKNFIVYLTDLPADAPEVLAAAVNCESNYALFQAGDGQKLGFSFANPDTTPRVYELQLKNAHGISFGNAKVTVPAGQTVRREIALTPSKATPLAELHIDGTLTVNGTAIPVRYGPIRVEVRQRVRKSIVWDASRGNPLTRPTGPQEDIHRNHSTGIAREVQDQTKATNGSYAEVIKDNELGRNVTKCHYYFARPVRGWIPSIWLASRYRFQKPIPLPGVPLKLTMRIKMKSNVTSYPVVMMYTFKDKTGKEIRIEGSNLWFTGWRSNECYLPSLLTDGSLHSVSGGNGFRAIDSYPLNLTGIVINLIPLSSSVHAPKDLPAVVDDLLFDTLELTYYE